VNWKLHRRKAELEKHERTGTPRPIANRSETLLRMNTGVVRVAAARLAAASGVEKARAGQQPLSEPAAPLSRREERKSNTVRSPDLRKIRPPATEKRGKRFLGSGWTSLAIAEAWVRQRSAYEGRARKKLATAEK